MRTARTAVASMALAVLLLAGCAPEPSDPTSTPAAGPTPTMSLPSTPSATPTVLPSATPTPSHAADDISLPTACEQLYSPAMLASLTAQAPPLNDPGVTMLATQNADLLEILHSGIPTMRCTWGAPSEFGLATNVSIVDAAQSVAVAAALRNGGFACSSVSGGTLCRFDQTVISHEDKEVHLGETHFLRGNGWVSTAWVNFAPQGYTEDIVATLWG